MSTGLMTEIISNNAKVLLTIVIAIETAQGMGANSLPFVLAVM